MISTRAAFVRRPVLVSAGVAVARKSWIRVATWSRWDSRRKCPPGSSSTRDPGRSFVKALEPSGPKISSFSPQMASSGTWEVRKYSCTAGYRGELVA
jgi:hypothetical protein